MLSNAVVFLMRKNQGSIEKDELAASMSRDLPAFMVPGVIRRVDEMPLTKNGKIDRKKLAEIAGGRRK